MPWMHLSCQEKADSYCSASALSTSCHMLSEVLQTRLRLEESQCTSGFLLTCPQDGWPGAETAELFWAGFEEAVGAVVASVVSRSSRSIR